MIYQYIYKYSLKNEKVKRITECKIKDPTPTQNNNPIPILKQNPITEEKKVETPTKAQENSNFPRILWVHWNSGYENAPFWTQLCRNNMEHYAK